MHYICCFRTSYNYFDIGILGCLLKYYGMNWLLCLAVNVNVQEGQIITLDLLTDKVFLNADNPIDHRQVRAYEQKIEHKQSLDPIGVVYIQVRPSILQELGCSDVIPLGLHAKKGDWIFLVTNGHHRAIASKNKGVPLKAKIIRIL